MKRIWHRTVFANFSPALPAIISTATKFIKIRNNNYPATKSTHIYIYDISTGEVYGGGRISNSPCRFLYSNPTIKAFSLMAIDHPSPAKKK